MENLKELIESLTPFLATRPMFGIFALGDGSGRYFCAACGAMTERPRTAPGGLMLMASAVSPITLTHTPECGFLAHGRAIEALKGALAEVEGANG